MSQENVEIVRAMYDAWDRRDFDAALDLIDERIEWTDPPGRPGGTTRRGHDGITRSMATWVGAWDDYSFELRELTAGGYEVLAEGWQRGRGKGSGIEVSEAIFSVWTIRAGKIVRQRMFRDRAEALEAAGLSE